MSSGEPQKIHFVIGTRLMTRSTEDGDLPADEIVRRMEMGIRRALNTPPTPTKDLIGKSERAIARRDSRVRKKGKPKPSAG